MTYVATWSGFAYVAFVTDVYSGRIVGWNVESTLRSKILPMQVLDMASRGAGGRFDELVYHADHGSNYTAMVYIERIVELGAVPSTGTVGDSAMAEAVDYLYKTELSGSAARGGRSSSRPPSGCGGGTTSAATASSTIGNVHARTVLRIDEGKTDQLHSVADPMGRDLGGGERDLRTLRAAGGSLPSPHRARSRRTPGGFGPVDSR